MCAASLAVPIVAEVTAGDLGPHGHLGQGQASRRAVWTSRYAEKSCIYGFSSRNLMTTKVACPMLL